jgi:hypothetical protein
MLTHADSVASSAPTADTDTLAAESCAQNFVDTYEGYICVLILLCMCPHTHPTIYVSAQQHTGTLAAESCAQTRLTYAGAC